MKSSVARIYSDNANTTKNKMHKIYEIIRKSAEQGLYFVILENLSGECIDELIAKGYEVNDNEAGEFTIEW